MSDINLEDEEHYYWRGYEDGTSVLKALIAERDAAKAENEKLREALDTAKTMLQTGLPEYDAADVLDVISAALGENK